MSIKHIISFSIPAQKENYKIYGDCRIETGTDLNGQSYPYPRFYDLKAEKIVNNQMTPYKPSGVNFTGHHYDESDMVKEAIAAALRMDNACVLDYTSPEVKGLIDHYLSKTEILTLSNMSFPKKLLHIDMYQPYELYLITDQYTYYIGDGLTLMLDTNTREIISDDYFAEDSLWASLEHAEKGKETLLWKKD